MDIPGYIRVHVGIYSHMHSLELRLSVLLLKGELGGNIGTIIGVYLHGAIGSTIGIHAPSSVSTSESKELRTAIISAKAPSTPIAGPQGIEKLPKLYPECSGFWAERESSVYRGCSTVFELRLLNPKPQGLGWSSAVWAVAPRYNHKVGFEVQGDCKLRSSIVPLKYIEYGVYGDLMKMYPKPYSIYLRGTTAQLVSLGN